MRRIILFAVSLILVFSAQALADSKSVTVPANRTTVLGGFSTFNEQTCHHGGKVKYRVVKQPAHGKFVVTFEKRQLSKNAGKCAGKLAGFMVMSYTPAHGYRGADALSIDFTYPQYVSGYTGVMKGKRLNFSVTVK